MIFALIFAALLGSAYSQCSPYGRTLDGIIDDFIYQADFDKDGHISLTEARQGILGRYVKQNETCVSRDDFATQFVLQYRDDYSLVLQFFDNLDADGDQCLGEIDFVFEILPYIDPNLNDKIHADAIRKFLHDKHPLGC